MLCIAVPTVCNPHDKPCCTSTCMHPRSHSTHQASFPWLGLLLRLWLGFAVSAVRSTTVQHFMFLLCCMQGNALWEWDGWSPSFGHGGIFHEGAHDTQWGRAFAFWKREVGLELTTSGFLCCRVCWGCAIVGLDGSVMLSVDCGIVAGAASGGRTHCGMIVANPGRCREATPSHAVVLLFMHGSVECDVLPHCHDACTA